MKAKTPVALSANGTAPVDFLGILSLWKKIAVIRRVGYLVCRHSRPAPGKVTRMRTRQMPDQLQVDNRKDLLLLLLAAADGEPVVGVTRLLKYVFLLQHGHRWEERFSLEEPYDFGAYHFGPFDSQIYDDLALLENVGLIESVPTDQPEPRAERGELELQALESGTSDPEVAPWEAEDVVRQYALTDKGRDFVERFQLDETARGELDEIKQRWNHRSLTELLRWLYQEYPEYATETKLTHLRPKSA